MPYLKTDKAQYSLIKVRYKNFTCVSVKVPRGNRWHTEIKIS